MKTDPKNPNTAPQKEVPTIKKDDKLSEDELNKVTGGTDSLKESVEFQYGSLQVRY